MQGSKSIVLMLQKDWILTDTWVGLNGFQDQVLKKFPLNIQELRKDHFYPMLRFVSKGSRRFLLVGSLLPLICNRRMRSTYGPHSGSSESFCLPSAVPFPLQQHFSRSVMIRTAYLHPKVSSVVLARAPNQLLLPHPLCSGHCSLPEKPGSRVEHILIRASGRCSIFWMTLQSLVGRPAVKGLSCQTNF